MISTAHAPARRVRGEGGEGMPPVGGAIRTISGGGSGLAQLRQGLLHLLVAGQGGFGDRADVIGDASCRGAVTRTRKGRRIGEGTACGERMRSPEALA